MYPSQQIIKSYEYHICTIQNSRAKGHRFWGKSLLRAYAQYTHGSDNDLPIGWSCTLYSKLHESRNCLSTNVLISSTLHSASRIGSQAVSAKW